jgi:hypothetical protein
MLAGLPFSAAWTEVLSCVESIGGLAVLAGLYRFAECHQEGCHRIGRFKHGHLRLCHAHHPFVPDDGKIDMTARPTRRVPEQYDDFLPRERDSGG